MSNVINRPVLRYHGGKFRLRSWIVSNMPAHQAYVEPFGGAASVLMAKPRSQAEIYNDLDGAVVNVFKVLRDPIQSQELERLLRLTPFAREEFEGCYDGEPTDPIERARRAIVKSFFGYGAGTVTRKDKTGFRGGFFNGRSFRLTSHHWVDYHDALQSFCARLQGVIIENRPALSVMESFDSPETLHYVDPPYVRATRGRAARMDYRHEMTDDDHRELAVVLHRLQGMVILSGYPSDLYSGLYGHGWQQLFRESHNARAHKRTECLWLRNVAGGLFND